MSRPKALPPFRLCHGDWQSLPAQRLGDKAAIRRLPGGDTLTWRLDLRAGARLASTGLKCECVLSVWAGRLACTLLGNRIDLPAGHFALIPPNIPLTLRVVGHAEVVVVGNLCHHLVESLPFEPL